MANLPDVQNSAVPEPQYSDRTIEMVARMVLRGKSINGIAKKLGDGDKRKYLRWYWRLREIARDERFQAIIMAESQADLVQAVPVAVRGARKMAGRRMDAVKWIGEASGFHNPRVDHNVSGDIQITMNIPRPDRTPDETEIVEAEVVE